MNLPKNELTNIDAITKTIAFKQIQIVDSSIKQYIESTIALLQSQDKDITDYALIAVNNPMEMIDNGLRVTSQWRIVEISKLQNLPTFDDGDEL